jgi:hypothetical protein
MTAAGFAAADAMAAKMVKDLQAKGLGNKMA